MMLFPYFMILFLFPFLISISSNKLDFDKIIVTNHINIYRFKHKSSFIVISNELSIEAQNYSDFMVTNKVYEDYDTYLGQNIHHSAIDKGTDAVLDAIDDWYIEMDYYNFAFPLYEYGSRDFVHMIWKQTNKFGIGVSNSDDFGTVVFVLFNHNGNYADRSDLLSNIHILSGSSIPVLNVFIMIVLIYMLCLIIAI